MKKSFKAFGKAVAYFGVYLLMQIVVSSVFSISLSTKLTMEMMATNQELDMVALTEQLTAEIMSYAMEMTLVAGVITLFVFWLIFIIRKKKFFAEVGIRAIPVEGILPIAIMAACFNLITSVVISIIPWPQAWMDSYATNSSMIDENSIFAWITAILMAPVLEEIVFRGLMYTRLKKGFPVVVAALLTSVAFGIAHGTIIWFIYTFIFSLVLIWVFERFQSLTACIVLHMAYNISGMGLSMIPEEAGMVIWVLFALSIVGAVVGYRLALKVSEDIPKVEEIQEEVVASLEEVNIEE